LKRLPLAGSEAPNDKLLQFLPELADAALRHVELAGGILGAVAKGEELGDLAVTGLEGLQPRGEVDAAGGQLGGGAGVVGDEDFFPALFLGVVVVEPFEHDVLQALAVFGRNVPAVQAAASHATVLDLGHAEAGQDAGVGEIELVQLGQTGDGAAGVANDGLNEFLAGLGIVMAKGDAGVLADAGKKPQEQQLPIGGRTCSADHSG